MGGFFGSTEKDARCSVVMIIRTTQKEAITIFASIWFVRWEYFVPNEILYEDERMHSDFGLPTYTQTINYAIRNCNVQNEGTD